MRQYLCHAPVNNKKLFSDIGSHSNEIEIVIMAGCVAAKIWQSMLIDMNKLRRDKSQRKVFYNSGGDGGNLMGR